MSQAKGHAIDATGFAESEVANYLRQYPDFFERHLPLLRTLRIPHQSGDSTVSLVERQVSVLRQRNDDLERRLTELVEVAKANNRLVDNIHELAMAFLENPDVDKRLERLETSLRERFGAERAVLVIFADGSQPSVSRPGFVKTVGTDDEGLKSFATFLGSARARCGPLRDKQKEFLFGREADSIASAAMVPIGPDGEIGFLTVGSKDANQFHSGQSVDFLARLGELVATVLKDGNDADVRD